MNPAAQIAIAAVAGVLVIVGSFTAVAALIRISPADPGPIEEVTPDGHHQA